ncbi:MAG: TRAP transporter large permease subunit, partial [Rhodospirillales bacterium]|nr:TRAP transporter large permease subunit [Rhodospirillales bacterium]
MGWIMALLPIALLLLGFPVFLTLLATALVLLLFFLDVPLVQMHITMFGSVDKFGLLAVPFFLFAGELMGRGGISRRLVTWVMALVGGVRGSLGLTTVGTCTIFGAISGSSPATVAAIGQIMFKPLRDAGYDEKFAVGVLTSSGAIAIVIPPSIAMILYGMAAEENVAMLFAAGILPGLLIAGLMGIYIYIYATRKGIREGNSFEMKVFLEASREGIWALG